MVVALPALMAVSMGGWQAASLVAPSAVWLVVLTVVSSVALMVVVSLAAPWALEWPTSQRQESPGCQLSPDATPALAAVCRVALAFPARRRPWQMRTRSSMRERCARTWCVCWMVFEMRTRIQTCFRCSLERVPPVTVVFAAQRGGDEAGCRRGATTKRAAQRSAGFVIAVESCRKERVGGRRVYNETPHDGAFNTKPIVACELSLCGAEPRRSARVIVEYPPA